MRIFQILVYLFFLVPTAGYTEIIVNEETNLSMDKTCLTNAMDNIKIKYPNISADDTKYIAIYGCFCAYKVAQQGTIAAVASDFRNVPNCVDYAVLRNAMRASGAGINNKCNAAYPHNLEDDSKTADIADFCKCAATPTETINQEITEQKLNEYQIFDKLMPIIKGCLYSV